MLDSERLGKEINSLPAPKGDGPLALRLGTIHAILEVARQLALIREKAQEPKA